MMALSDVMDQGRTRIDALLAGSLPAAGVEPVRLHQAMHYASLNGGKRVRPLLAYLTGRTLGADEADIDAVALSVELIHAYSLVHDDLPAMDDDDLRRGRPTCHIAFDEATAILAGDALHTLAFSVLCRHPLSATAAPQRLDMLQLLTEASGSLGMGGGQAIDLEASGKQLQLDDLATMHRMKTGALIRASVQMSALCHGQPDPAIESALTEYADAIGLAFQVKDDILDVEGDTDTLGKPQGSDLANEKSTYPALLGLDGAKAKAEELLAQSLHALAKLPYNTRLLAEFAAYVVRRDY